MNIKPIAIFLALAFFLQTPFTGTVEAKASLSDISSSPYLESINYLIQKEVIKGNPDGSFKPEILMTRAEFITLMVRTFSPIQDSDSIFYNCFPDVHEEWYATYICYAKEQKMIKGYPDGNFLPGGNVSYVEAMSMAISAAKIEITKDPKETIWYKPFLEFAHLNNIFSKYAMLPGTALTREKAAFIIHQILLIEDGTKKISKVRKNYSLGCGITPPKTPPDSGIISAIPSTYDENTPIKFVVAIHGRTNSNSMVRGYYKVEQAAQGKAIVVYPSDLTTVDSFDSILAQYSKKYCLDLDEVYVVGHSLGGSMTSELACARGDVIRGIANVGGGASLRKSCSGPVAAMIWHNPKDNLVSFDSGLTARDNILRQNQLGDKNISVEPKSANCVAYTDGSPDAPLIWCPHTQDYEDYGKKAYYPHVWPKTAGPAIWKFFSERIENRE